MKALIVLVVLAILTALAFYVVWMNRESEKIAGGAYIPHDGMYASFNSSGETDSSRLKTEN